MKLFSVGVLFAAAVSRVYAQAESDTDTDTDFYTSFFLTIEFTDLPPAFPTDLDFTISTPDPDAYYTSMFGPGGASLHSFLETRIFTTPFPLLSWASKHITWTGGSLPSDFPYGAYSEFITQYFYLTEFGSYISGFTFHPFTNSFFTFPSAEAAGSVATATATGTKASATGSSPSKSTSQASSGSTASTEENVAAGFHDAPIAILGLSFALAVIVLI